MDKYIGNKSSLIPLLSSYITARVPEARSLSDPFTGTTNVARHFRARGWDVIVADINRFCHTLANVYIGRQTQMTFERVLSKHGNVDTSNVRHLFDRATARLQPSLISSTSSDLWPELEHGARAIAALQAIADANLAPGFIYQHFTKFGDQSGFRSIRGRSGRRNYFSRENALCLDGALKTIRNWWRSGLLSRDELDFLMTSVIEEIVITANVTGTFHDFNRERLWPNALQRFTLRVPISERHDTATTILNADAVSSVSRYPDHDVCYLDPPYNFRQYTAYYHFLNFIAAYPHLDSIQQYLHGLNHVRGQNMDDDYTSEFSCRRNFITALTLLIQRIPTRHVFLSYYGGRNHWNHWADVKTPGNEGLQQLSDVFSDPKLFSHHESTSALDIRKNFQSRVGEQKTLVNEYLFYGRKRSTSLSLNSSNGFAANTYFGLEAAFAPIIRPALREKDLDKIGVEA